MTGNTAARKRGPRKGKSSKAWPSNENLLPFVAHPVITVCAIITHTLYSTCAQQAWVILPGPPAEAQQRSCAAGAARPCSSDGALCCQVAALPAGLDGPAWNYCYMVGFYLKIPKHGCVGRASLCRSSPSLTPHPVTFPAPVRVGFYASGIGSIPWGISFKINLQILSANNVLCLYSVYTEVNQPINQCIYLSSSSYPIL